MFTAAALVHSTNTVDGLNPFNSTSCPGIIGTPSSLAPFTIQLYLGVYESEVDAAKAHDRAARFHFAENAVCNFDNEHEADRQALLHKQRQLVEQHQVAEERAHQIALHGGGFVAGREEFDDLEEYHRGLEMEGASCSEEGEGEGEGGGDADGEGEEETEEDMPTFGETRSSRSLSTSSATSLSSGSMMSADDAAPAGGSGVNAAEQEARPHQQQHRHQQEQRSAALSSSWGGGGGVVGNGNNQHNMSYQLAEQYHSGVMATAVAAAAAAGPTNSAPSSGRVSIGAGLHYDGSVNLHGQGGGASQHHHHRGMSTGSAGDSDSDFTPVSAFFQDLEPTPLEGMGFPYAENLLGYEMQSWYNCHDNDLSPTNGGGLSEFVDSEPLITPQQQPQRGGMGVGWGFSDFGQPTRQGSNSSVTSAVSGFSTSDEDYVPSALPPLMGMCADP